MYGSWRLVIAPMTAEGLETSAKVTTHVCLLIYYDADCCFKNVHVIFCRKCYATVFYPNEIT